MFSNSRFVRFFLTLTLALITGAVAFGQDNIPPTVTITSPSSGATFAAPASITIVATVGDVDGLVERVEYFANGGLLGVTTTPPHELKWVNVAAGTYNVQAIATDNGNTSTTSSA